MNYKPLEKEFTKVGFFHKQLKRKGSIAIYERSKKLYAFPSFEVIIVKKHDGWEIAGNKIPPAEVYPNNEDFGTLAWTFNKLDRAEKQFSHLVDLDKKGKLPS